jgi:hypothetical protein
MARWLVDARPRIRFPVCNYRSVKTPRMGSSSTPRKKMDRAGSFP